MKFDVFGLMLSDLTRCPAGAGVVPRYVPPTRICIPCCGTTSAIVSFSIKKMYKSVYSGSLMSHFLLFFPHTLRKSTTEYWGRFTSVKHFLEQNTSVTKQIVDARSRAATVEINSGRGYISWHNTGHT